MDLGEHARCNDDENNSIRLKINFEGKNIIEAPRKILVGTLCHGNPRTKQYNFTLVPCQFFWSVDPWSKLHRVKQFILLEKFVRYKPVGKILE